MSGGVLIFEGMKVGVRGGDLTISVDEYGTIDANVILSTSYNLLPVWLRIAYENTVLALKANERVSE